MIGRLFINGLDAWIEYKVVLDKGSFDSLRLPAPMKDMASNDMGGQHGVQYYTDYMRVDERDLTLTFNFVSCHNYKYFFDKFVDTIQSSDILLEIPFLHTGYNLIYKSSKSYTSIKYAGKLQVQFIEPNPKNRTEI